MATLPNMPAPKNSGLALLADTANEEQGIYHYPVRRRGLPRALLPNREAIAWLEADQAATEIEYTETSVVDGLVYTFAVGRVGKSYPRPMLQVIHDETFSSFRGVAACACPCGDFSRTAYCDEHGEVEYDWNRRAWIRPGTSLWYEHHPEDRPGPPERLPDGQPTAYVSPELLNDNPSPSPGLYERLMEMYGQRLPPYDGRQIWVTADQVANYGTSRCTCSACAAVFRTPESNPENPFTTSSRVPDTERWLDRVLGLQSGTIRVDGVFGEGSFTFEIEEDAGGDTRTP